LTRTKIPYLKQDFKTRLSAVRAWKLFDDAQGCTPLDLQGMGLSMNKNPPPLITETTMTKPPDKPVAATKNLAQKNEQPLLVAA
jgi:hypothetical protein